MVTITGNQFQQNVSVTFGDRPAATVQFVDPTTVKVTTPNQQLPGAVDVRIDAGADLIAVAQGGFTYKK